MKPQKLKLKIKNIDWLTDKIVQLRFTPVDPTEIEFIPGQHMNVIVDPETSRPYCFFTDASNTSEVGICVSAGHDGKGSNYLKALKVGDEIEAFGPVGRLKIKTDYAENIVFAATGTGIAPMLSMLDMMVADGVKSDVKLYFGLRNEEDKFYEDVLEEYKGKLENFSYEYVYSKPSNDWKGLTGYVTDAVEPDSEGNTQYYIVGHWDMVQSLEAKLLEAGIPQENIAH